MDCISTLTLNVQIQVFLLYKVFCISFIFIEPSLKWWQGIISFKHPCVCSFMLNANWIVETSKMYSPRLTGPNLMILAPAGRKIPSKICSLTRAYVSNGLSGTGVLKPKAPRCPSCCGELCNSSTRATSAAATCSSNSSRRCCISCHGCVFGESADDDDGDNDDDAVTEAGAGAGTLVPSEPLFPRWTQQVQQRQQQQQQRQLQQRANTSPNHVVLWSPPSIVVVTYLVV